MWLLAAQDNDPVPVIIWSLVLVGIVLLAFVGVSLVRRWATKVEPTEPAGFTLGDLRQLYKSGKMSADEFERARAKIIATARKEDETTDEHR